jgi:hypothetical protein
MTNSDDTTAQARAQVPILKTRGYQQEMLDESLRRNIVIALDTGSGKTHIAVLRLKLEAERESRKARCFRRRIVALLMPSPSLGLVVPRADRCACAAAEGCHRKERSCPRRAHLGRERARPMERPRALAPRPRLTPYHRQHA